ncbi:DoxX family membrane protein [Aquipuribacter sp. MA13-6]|uniref:DoxX family membrane protein n=1 Tax=unclassified Aquipuribacter TaxID=2635084 RepID=UPI003EE9F1B3
MFRRIARPLLAAVFVNSGVDALRNPEPRAKLAAGMVHAAAERFGTPDDPLLAARLNAGVMVGGGLGLASGLAPRLSALALAGSLVPTTLAGHAFWEYPKEERAAQRVQFTKNLGLLAGLLLTIDTPYAAERAARKTRKAVEAEHAAEERERSSKQLRKQAKKDAKEAAKAEAHALKVQAKAEKARTRLERERDED